jgi:hypothetical protein
MKWHNLQAVDQWRLKSRISGRSHEPLRDDLPTTKKAALKLI